MPIDGVWEFTINAPMGVFSGMLWLLVRGHSLKGAIRGRDQDLPIQHGEVIGRDELFWTVDTHAPARITMQFSVAVIGTQMFGEIEIGDFGTATLDATFLGSRDEAAWNGSARP